MAQKQPQGFTSWVETRMTPRDVEIKPNTQLRADTGYFLKLLPYGKPPFVEVTHTRVGAAVTAINMNFLSTPDDIMVTRQQIYLNKPLPLIPGTSSGSAHSTNCGLDQLRNAAMTLKPADGMSRDPANLYKIPESISARIGHIKYSQSGRIQKHLHPSLVDHQGACYYHNSSQSACGATPSSTVIAAPRSEPIQRSKRATHQVVLPNNDNDFKSFNYDDVAERPIIFHPQARLLDLPKRRKSNKFSISGLLRSSTLWKQSNVRKSQTTSCLEVPPRPARPPAQLCPSPPFNSANMPNHDLLSESVREGSIAKGHMLLCGSRIASSMDDLQMPTRVTSQSTQNLHPPSATFVQYVDLKQPSRRHDVQPHYGTNQAGMKQSVSQTTNHSSIAPSPASNHISPYDNRAVTKTFTSPMRQAHNHDSINHKSYRGYHSGSSKLASTKLDYVPEYASLKSFTSGYCHRDKKERDSSAALPRADYSRYSMHNHILPSPWTTSGSNLSRVSSNTVDDHETELSPELKRIQAVSGNLRERYSDEWDRIYQTRPSSSQMFATAYSSIDGLSQCESTAGPSNCSSPCFASDDTIAHSAASLELLTAIDPITQKSTEQTPKTILNIVHEPMSTHAETVHDDFGKKINDLVPAPLRNSDSLHSVNRKFFRSPQEGVKQTTKSIRSPRVPSTSASSTSMNHRNRVFSGSMFDRSSTLSAVSELSDWEDFSPSQPPSPLLPRPSLPISPRHTPQLSASLANPAQSIIDHAPESPYGWSLHSVESSLRPTEKSCPPANSAPLPSPSHPPPLPPLSADAREVRLVTPLTYKQSILERERDKAMTQVRGFGSPWQKVTLQKETDTTNPVSASTKTSTVLTTPGIPPKSTLRQQSSPPHQPSTSHPTKAQHKHPSIPPPPPPPLRLQRQRSNSILSSPAGQLSTIVDDDDNNNDNKNNTNDEEQNKLDQTSSNNSIKTSRLSEDARYRRLTFRNGTIKYYINANGETIF